jgi:hypothetical protein
MTTIELTDRESDLLDMLVDGNRTARELGRAAGWPDAATVAAMHVASTYYDTERGRRECEWSDVAYLIERCRSNMIDDPWLATSILIVGDLLLAGREDG